MSGFKQIPLTLLRDLTNTQQERNIYAHPSILARIIFWQRLRFGFRLIKKIALQSSHVLDFGGGSGAFLPSLASYFDNVSVIDLDLDDARRIVNHYSLSNVRLQQQDISSWRGTSPFDVVTAMDVLEHFSDMDVPLSFFEQHLKPRGLMLVSLPTENALYELGRRILRKEKPADHYHSARDLVRFYRKHGYTLLNHGQVPRLGIFSLPLFFVGVFQKHA